MKRQFPFIGETPELIDGSHIRRMGNARWLFSYLVKKQTAPDGTVNYGRPMTYAEIQSEMHHPRRTLERWMRWLREEGYVESRPARRGPSVVGLIVRIARPKKFRTQLGLFPPAQASESSASLRVSASPVGNAEQNPVDKLRNSRDPLYADLRGGCTQICGGSSLGVEETSIDKIFRAGPLRADGSRLWNQEQKAKRLEREIEALRDSYAGTPHFDPSYIRFCEKFDALTAELARTRSDMERARAGERMATG